MGRWSKEKHAQEAAKKAERAAKAVQGEADPAPVNEEEPSPSPDFKPIGPRDNPRDAMMEEVIARHEKGSEVVPEPGAEPAPAAAPAPGEPVAAIEPAPAAIPSPPAAVEAIKMTKQKVDGEDYDVSQTEIDEAGGPGAWRIARAAENRLRKTNETLAETKRIQVQMAQWLAQNMSQQPKPPDAEFIAAQIEAIRFGTPEQASTALTEIMARGTQKIDPAQIMSQAVIQVRRQSAAEKFGQDFAEISSNPTLMRLAQTIENDMLAELQRGGATLPQFAAFDWNKFYGMIGNQVRSVIGKPSQPAPASATAAMPVQAAAASTASPPSSQSEKEARKASIITLPTAAARAELPKEEKPETREDVLRHMRKTRGLLVD